MKNTNFYRIIFFHFLILYYCGLIAQPTTGSAVTSSMNTGVGEFTGTLNLSFPMGSVTSGNLSSGLQLGYVGNGYKPNLPSSEVGMDWFLNSGFSISRQVMGVPDEFSLVGDAYGDSYDYNQIQCVEVDGELDLYTFSGFGQSVNFTIDYGTAEVFIINRNELVITPFFKLVGSTRVGIDSFQVVSTEGTLLSLIPTQYTIEPIVWNLCQTGAPPPVTTFEYVTSWSPIRLKSYHSSADQIDFNYDPNFKEYQYNGLESDPIKGKNKQLLSIIGLNDTLQITYDTRTDLTSIGSNGNQGKVNRIYYRNADVCYYQAFSVDDYNNTGAQLKLNWFQKVSCNDLFVSEPKTEFTYLNTSNIKPKNTASLDHWGFANDKTNDPNNLLDLGSGGNSDRSVHSASAQIGMLNSVKDINGKITSFIYEPHVVTIGSEYIGSPASICNISNCYYPNSSLNYVSILYNTANQIDATLAVDTYFDGLGSNVTITFYQGSLTSSNYITRSWNSDGYGIQQFYASLKLADLLDTNGNPFFISGQNYFIKITGVSVSAKMNLTYLQNTNETIGGLRLKSINEGGEITSYSYKDAVLYNEANKYELFTKRWITVNSQTINLNYMSGSHIGYGEVTVSKSGLGTTVSVFKSTFIKEVSAGKRNACDLLIQGIGSLLSKKTFGEYNSITSEEYYTYKTDIYSYGKASNRFIQKTSCNFFGNNCSYYGLRYRYQQFLIRPLTKTTYMYGVETGKTVYEYNHPHTLQPSIVKTINGPDESLIYFNYSSGYFSDNNVKNTFINNNIRVPIQSVEYHNGLPVNAQRTEYNYYSSTGTSVGNGGYTNSSNKVRPSTIYKNDCDGVNASFTPEYADHYFLTYTSDGLVQEDQKANWSTTTYTYNRKRISSKTTNGFTTSYTYNGNSKNASRITNPDGTYQDFLYDQLGRLKRTTDFPSGNKIEYEYYFKDYLSNPIPYNIVVTKTISPSAVNGRTTWEARQFFNTFGRLVQSLQINGAFGPDVADYFEYDAYGRQTKSYQSFTGSSSSGNLIALPVGTKFTETKYENSPLSRILEVKSPDWYTTYYQYGLNSTTDEVKNPQSGFQLFASNKLFKETMIDGDGNKIIKFSDFKGRLICSRQTDNTDSPTGGKRKDTYTKYDNKSRAILIVPPGSTELITAQNYEYTYDARDRMTGKKVPSKGWTNYWYNTKNLLSVQKDGNNKYIAYEYNTDGQIIKESLRTNLPSNFDLPTNSSDLLKEFAYGTTGIEKGKLKWKRARILDNTKMMKSQIFYDSRGRIDKIASSNFKNSDDLMTYGMTQNIILLDTITNVYDQLDNMISNQNVVKPIISSAAYRISNTTVNTYDYIQRLKTETFSYQFGSQSGSQQIASYSYNHWNELTQNNQGGGLQLLDYYYRSTGQFERLNDESLSGNDLFHYQLYYDNPIMGAPNSLKKNGNISNIKYKVKNGVARLNEFRYDIYNQVTKSIYYEYNGSSFVTNGKYNEDFTYYTNGRLNTLVRNGDQVSNQSNYQIDNLTYVYSTDNLRLTRVTESNTSSNNTLGHNQRGITGTAFTYDNCGNVTVDLHRAISNITYNHLNLPKVVTRSDGSKLEMVYDADGNLLSRKVYSAGGTLTETKEYLGAVELVNNVVSQINHSQGRLQKFGTTYRFEYVIKDHLGNARVVYYNNGGTATVIDENHYYAYGMDYAGFAPVAGTTNYNYKFNGIERVESFNLDFAFYRGLDPVLGLWMQVDPKAEDVIGMYPYCAMGNNPISQVDPAGDLFWVAVGVGFATGVISNGIINQGQGENFWSNGFSAGLWGAATAAASYGVGGVFGKAGSVFKEIGRAGGHALTQGTLTHMQGGSFWHGAASGGLSSLGGSVMQGLNFDPAGMLVGGAALGGLGSKISGGDFWQGFATGIAVGAFNHMVHAVAESLDPIWPKIDEKTGKFILEGFEDAEYLGKSKGVGHRHVWKLPDGKYLEWTSKNGVVEMFSKDGKTWLGKYNPTTGSKIVTTAKVSRIASFVGKGITYVGTKLSMLLTPLFYTGPGSGFDFDPQTSLQY